MTPPSPKAARIRSIAALALTALAALTISCATQPTTRTPQTTRHTNTTPAQPESSPVLSIEPWTFNNTPGSIIRTNHYRIYTTAQSAVITQRLADYLERSIDHYTTAITPLPEPDQKLDVYLMANRPQWANLTRRLLREHADNPLAIGRGGYATRGIGVYYDIGLYDTLAIAGHEGWHQYTQRTFKDHLPIYLEEAIATWMEGHRWIDAAPTFTPWANLQRHDQLRSAQTNGRLLTLSQLVNVQASNIQDISPTAILDYYAQVWALAHFLTTDEHIDTTRRLLTDAAAGTLWPTVLQAQGRQQAVTAFQSRTGPAVIQTYYDTPLSKLDQDYAAFIQTITAQGARQRLLNNEPPIGIN